MNLIVLVCIKTGRTKNNVRFELAEPREYFLSELLSPVLRCHLADGDRHVEDAAREDFVGLRGVLDGVPSSWVKHLDVCVN